MKEKDCEFRAKLIEIPPNSNVKIPTPVAVVLGKTQAYTLIYLQTLNFGDLLCKQTLAWQRSFDEYFRSI